MRRIVLIAMVAALMGSIGIVPASADHSPPGIGKKWKNDGTIAGDFNIETYFTEGFPNGAKRDRVKNGGAEWNAVTDGPRYVFKAAEILNFNPTRECKFRGATTIHWVDPAEWGVPGANGVMVGCVYEADRTRMWNASIDFNPGKNWYDGVGDASDGFLGSCVPSCETDMWSVATHELGHGMGLGHHDDNASLCDANDKQETMCPKYTPGSERMRTEEQHERAKFKALY